MIQATTGAVTQISDSDEIELVFSDPCLDDTLVTISSVDD